MNVLRKRRKSKNKLNAHKFILIIFFLMMTTFAWFTYYKVLNVKLDIHMASWDVQFLIDGVALEDNLIEIEVPNLYPAMEDLVYEVKVKNNGETTIDLSYYVEQLIIIGNTYDILQEGDTTTNEYFITLGQQEITNNIATQSIINDVTQYPFTVNVENTVLLGTGEEGYIKLKISWDGTNDELDSKWGYDVGKYFINNTAKENTNETEETAEMLSAMKLLLRIDVIQATV